MTTSQISQRVGSQTTPHLDKNGVEYLAYTSRLSFNPNGRAAFITTVRIIDHKTKRNTEWRVTSGHKQGGVLETEYTNRNDWKGYSTRVKEFDTLEEALLALKKRIQNAMPKDVAENWVNELFT